MFYPCSENKGADQLRVRSASFVFAFAKIRVSHIEAQIGQSSSLTRRGSETASNVSRTEIEPMSGTMFREDMVIKIFLRPFFNFHLFLNNGERIYT